MGLNSFPMTTNSHCGTIIVRYLRKESTAMKNSTISTTATITPNWQIHIPVKIRQAIGLNKHGKVRVEAKNNQIIIKKQKPQDDIMSIIGSLKTKTPKGLDIDNLRDHIDYSDL